MSRRCAGEHLMHDASAADKAIALKANGHPPLISFDVYHEKQLLHRSNKSQSITYAVSKPFDLSPHTPR